MPSNHEVNEEQKTSFSMPVVRRQYWVRSDWSGGWLDTLGAGNSSQYAPEAVSQGSAGH